MRKIVLILSLFYTVLCFSQERNISGYFSENTIFYTDTTYILEYNTKIASVATLTIQPGTSVKFNSGASLIIEGNLICNGNSHELIKFTSLDNEYQGIGIIISGTKGKVVDIQFTIFDELLIPLTFNDIWYRDSVTIQNNIFSNINSGQAAINVGMFAQVFSEKEIPFIFDKNNFINNNATIYFATIEDANLNLQLRDNIFISNVMFDRNNANPQNAILSLYYDQRDMNNLIDIRSNSFVNNKFISLTSMESLNIGIMGSADRLDISGNYFNSSQPYNTLVHFYQNKSLPLILLTNNTNLPSEHAHLHVYKVLIKEEDVWVEWDVELNKYYENLELKLLFNRDYKDLENHFKVININNDTMVEKDVIFSIIDSSARSITIKHNSIDLANNVVGLPIGFDDEGFASADFMIGNVEKYLRIKYTKPKGKTDSIHLPKDRLIQQDIDLLDKKKSRFRLNVSAVKFFKDVRESSKIGFYTSFTYKLNKELSFYSSLSTVAFKDNNTFERVSFVGIGLESQLLEYKNKQTSLDFNIGISNSFYSKKKIVSDDVFLDLTNNSISIPVSIVTTIKFFREYNFSMAVSFNKSFSNYLSNLYSFSIGVSKQIK